MSKEELNALVTLLMYSDPWPFDDPNVKPLLEAFADREAKRLGFTDWTEAYHALPALT
jgi:hypothetical protein